MKILGCNHRFFCSGHIQTGIWRAGYRLDCRGFSLLDMGTLEQKLASSGTVSAWSQTLHVTEAAVESTCTYESGATVHSFAYCLLDHQLVIIKKTVTGADGISLTYSFSPQRATVMPLSDTTIGYDIDTWKRLRGTVSFFSTQSDVTAENDGRAITLTSHGAETILFLAFDEEAVQFARTHTPEEIWKSHCEAWNRFWTESTVPADKLPQRVLEAARTSEYHLRISSTRWSMPVGIYPTHWHGRYFGFDEFFALNGLLASGHIELARKIPRFRMSHLQAARERVHSYHSQLSEAAHYVWETTEVPGVEGAPHGFWLDHIFHHAHIGLGAWFCYEARPDKAFLQETAYPLMRACAEFYRQCCVVEKAPGQWVMGKCTDLERLGPSRENAFMTTCGAIALFRAARKAAALLQCDEDLQQKWTVMAQKLTETLPRNGQAYVPYPGCQEKSIALLSGLFPYGNLPADDPLQRQAVMDFCAQETSCGNMYPIGKSLCTWYAGWKALAFLQLGETAIAKTVVTQMAEETGNFSEVFEILESSCHPWFTTGEGILLQAICRVFA